MFAIEFIVGFAAGAVVGAAGLCWIWDGYIRAAMAHVEQRCGDIALAEFAYWRDAAETATGDQQLMHMGAVSAASNIVGSIVLGRSAEQHAAGKNGPATPAKE